MKKQVLNNLQKKLLKLIGKSELSKDFVWTGGTAMAYLFNHRLSEDLDFFSQNLYPDEYILLQINQIKKYLKINKIKQIKNKNRFLFELTKNKQNLKLEFVYFPFENLKKPKKCQEFNLKISSVEDMATNKLFALYERAEAKDIFDLYYFLIEKNYTLNYLIKNIEKKFEIQIDITQLYKQAKIALEKQEVLKPLLIKKINAKKLDKLFNLFNYKNLTKLLLF